MPLSKLRAYTIVSRWEYLPGEMMAAPVVLMMSVTTLSLPVMFRAVEAFIAFLSFFFAGFMINALTDYDVDKTYGSFKSDMPRAVDSLGKGTVWGLVVGQCTLAQILALHISIQIGSVVPALIMVLGVFFGMGYSAEPFRFKERGVLSAISLSFSAFFLPPAFLVYSIRGDLPLSIAVFFLGFAVIHYGLEFGNQANDYRQDKEHNIMTPPVRWGLAPSLRIGLVMMLTGLLVEVFGLWYIFVEWSSPASPYLVLPAYVLAVFFIILGYRKALSGYVRMIRIADRFPSGEATDRMRELCVYSRWQISGISGALLAVAILFLSTMIVGMWF